MPTAAPIAAARPYAKRMRETAGEVAAAQTELLHPLLERRERVRTLELVRTDRTGGSQTLRAKVYGGLSREGFRTLLMQIREPEEMRGAAVLITERVGANHVFMSPAGLPEVRQIRGAPGQSTLFGTDFSYEDLERLYGLERPLESYTLEGTQTTDGGRSVWQLDIFRRRQHFVHAEPESHLRDGRHLHGHAHRDRRRGSRRIGQLRGHRPDSEPAADGKLHRDPELRRSAAIRRVRRDRGERRRRDHRRLRLGFRRRHDRDRREREP